MSRQSAAGTGFAVVAASRQDSDLVRASLRHSEMERLASHRQMHDSERRYQQACAARDATVAELERTKRSLAQAHNQLDLVHAALNQCRSELEAAGRSLVQISLSFKLQKLVTFN